MAVKDAEHQLNLEISENEARKDFSKAERIDYARKLERIESLKAKEKQAEYHGNQYDKKSGITPNLVEVYSFVRFLTKLKINVPMKLFPKNLELVLEILIVKRNILLIIRTLLPQKIFQNGMKESFQPTKYNENE